MCRRSTPSGVPCSAGGHGALLVLVRSASVAGAIRPHHVRGSLCSAAAATGLIRPVAAEFQFRHPIVRRAAYESASAGWRLGAHGRAAAALEAVGAPLHVYAYHVERSARAGDERAVALLGAAAKASGLRAPMTAAHWLSAALRLLPEQAPVTTRLDLLVPLATAWGRWGTGAEPDNAAKRAGPIGPRGAYVRARVVALLHSWSTCLANTARRRHCCARRWMMLIRAHWRRQS